MKNIKNPGMFCFYQRVPFKGDKEQVKARLRVLFDHHLNRFMDNIELLPAEEKKGRGYRHQ